MKEREEKLLDAFLNGRESAFEELVEENRERLYKTVMRIVRNHDDALDVVQESLLKAYGSYAMLMRKRPRQSAVFFAREHRSSRR